MLALIGWLVSIRARTTFSRLFHHSSADILPAKISKILFVSSSLSGGLWHYTLFLPCATILAVRLSLMVLAGAGLWWYYCCHLPTHLDHWRVATIDAIQCLIFWAGERKIFHLAIKWRWMMIMMILCFVLVSLSLVGLVLFIYLAYLHLQVNDFPIPHSLLAEAYFWQTDKWDGDCQGCFIWSPAIL